MEITLQHVNVVSLHFTIVYFYPVVYFSNNSDDFVWIYGPRQAKVNL